MDVRVSEYIIRSIQKDFADNWPGAYSDVDIFYDGQNFDPKDYSEYVQVMVDGPVFAPSHGNDEWGTIAVDVKVFAARDSKNPHRVIELAAAVTSVLHRRSLQVKNYPVGTAQYNNGFVRYGEVEQTEVDLEETHAAGGWKVPMRQMNVSVEGIVEFTA